LLASPVPDRGRGRADREDGAARNAALAEAALDTLDQGVCVFDRAERLVLFNRAYLDIVNLPADRVRPGLNLRQLIDLSVAAGNHPGESAETLYLARAERVRGRRSGRDVLPFRDGRQLAVGHRYLPDGGWIATYEDVTERHRAENRLIFLDRHDPRTGLANRVELEERLAGAVQQARGSGAVGVLCLELDRFKLVNDTLGPAAGEALLRAVAARLTTAVRATDVVARLTGDLFVILAVGLGRAEDAGRMAQRIITLIAEPFEIDDRRIAVQASIGIALAPDDGGSPAQLLRATARRPKAARRSASSNPPWTPGCRHAGRLRSTCGPRSTKGSSCSTSSPSSIYAPAG
jgi:diguanylate cyclase (GGDEF)-like protein